MKNRWLIYIIVGILFGVFDFYYQEFTASVITSKLKWFIVAWGIWLIPVTPIAIYEAKVTQSRLKSAYACAITWSISILSYYLFLIVKIVFIGQSSLKELHISNYKSEFYWSNLKSLFTGDFFSGVTEWIGIAIAGGFIIGFSASFIYLRLSTNIKERSIQ
ncbi:hypothetical protein [Pseudobacteroides cellulosolvens]|uniref:DUF4199 domain-containing protein n=1 Tax=Pseudobacteroides cellulosolvens ATCC 35603 = DSM 2933 TaxID=398512 RepID=A0A0L6JIF2_9FIRM|nr:hypothetical protein [Pseudobacteroides cellulosolvens]KNY25636.1 hypothetical protein Bccel_0896 [Pseudobacteroides cellulosolvens ATCC 35603 = DSM 2933]